MGDQRALATFYRLSLLFGGNNASMIGFPDLLRDAQPGTAKQHRDLVTVFSYLTLMTKSILRILMAYDLGLGTQVRRY